MGPDILRVVLGRTNLDTEMENGAGCGELWEMCVKGGMVRPKVRGHLGSGKGSQVCAVTAGPEL